MRPLLIVLTLLTNLAAAVVPAAGVSWQPSSSARSVLTARPGPSAAPAGTVRVRLYDRARVAAPIIERAKGIVEETFARAGVGLGWTDCTGAASDPACSRVPAADEILVRIEPRDRQGGGRTCGTALRPAGGTTAHYATVFADCVLKSAAASLVQPALVLASVVAHEIGHLLLPDEGHAGSGLMAPRLDWSDPRLAHRDAPQFTEAEARAIRAAALARAGAAESADA